MRIKMSRTGTCVKAEPESRKSMSQGDAQTLNETQSLNPATREAVPARRGSIGQRAHQEVAHVVQLLHKRDNLSGRHAEAHTFLVDGTDQPLPESEIDLTMFKRIDQGAFVACN